MPPLLHALFSPSTPSPLPALLSPPKKPLSCSSHLQFPSLRRVRCSLVSVPTESPPKTWDLLTKPSPAEVSRTIMELASNGTISSLTPDGWSLGIGARFVVDAQGTPAVCLNQTERLFVVDGRSSFHVQFEQSGSRTPQCSLLGSLSKPDPDDEYYKKKLFTKWDNKYGEEIDEDSLYLFSVEKVLQIDDFTEGGVWVAPAEYLNAEPDPLRNFAEKIVDEMNSRHFEDVRRLCNIYVEIGFEVKDANIIWVDRLGFDVYINLEKGVFAARIPFPGEVVDEKGVKSSFNSMSHLAWEIEKSYATPDFEKVKNLRKIM